MGKFNPKVKGEEKKWKQELNPSRKDSKGWSIVEPTCPKCGSKSIGILTESEEEVKKICEKEGRSLSEHDREVQDKALETARLISDYGKVATVVLVGKRVKPPDAEEVLLEERKLNDHLFELIVEAEKKALRRRFW